MDNIAACFEGDEEDGPTLLKLAANHIWAVAHLLLDQAGQLHPSEHRMHIINEYASLQEPERLGGVTSWLSGSQPLAILVVALDDLLEEEVHRLHDRLAGSSRRFIIKHPVPGSECLALCCCDNPLR